ncbi:MAG: hypothetical protein QXX68_01545 [Candidatus Pacearchaeota archaeon]
MARLIKITKVFILLILILSFSSAIKISPTKQTLEMKQGETKCVNIWILPEKNYTIGSKWSFDGKGDLEKYNLTAEKIKVEIEYNYSEGKYEFCFTPKYGGNFSGIIYFYDEENMIEIGSWVDLKVEGEKFVEKISLFAGNIIREYKKNEINTLLMICLILLIIAFFAIVRYS